MLPALLLVVAGCGGSSVPECNGEDVKSVIYDIARIKMTDVLMLRGNGMTISMFRAYHYSEEYIEEQVAPYREKADGLVYSVVGTRLQSKNDETRSCSCAATLNVDGNGVAREVEIKYTAQYSDDGMVYVEVQGL